MLKLSESELFPELTKRFQDWVKTVENGELNWYDCHYLGVALYEYCEALWQVFGKRGLVNRQEAHLIMARMAFDWTVKVIDQGRWEDKPHQDSLRDRALAMKAVVCASLSRLDDSGMEREDASDILAELVGQGDQPGQAVARSTRRAQEHPSIRHLAAVTNALAYRLNCGERLGFLTEYNPTMAAALTLEAVRLFGDNTQTLDHERAYRELRLDMALAFAFTGRPDETEISKHYAELALKSAKSFGDTEHARRAQLILRFGSLGNRLAYMLILLQNKQGKQVNRI